MGEIMDNLKLLPSGTLRRLISIAEIGSWVWNLSSGVVNYSAEYSQLLGYKPGELKSDVTAWENLVLPEDLTIANSKIDGCLSGNTPNYVAEFRMIKKDGTIIWAQDKGSVTEYDEEGKPFIFCGVLQDVTRLKNAELDLVEQQHLLNLAIEVAEFGMWDWDLELDTITYNQTYLDMVGYKSFDEFSTFDGWDNMNHPDDRQRARDMLDDYLSGKITKYECEIRVRHRDGHYIWVRDVGKIMSYDKAGKVKRVIGGHLNINRLKTSQNSLSEALDELEEYKNNLEQQIEIRSKTLIEQDRMLLTINKISQQLVSVESVGHIGDIIDSCLKELCSISDRNRIALWRNHMKDDTLFSKIIHSYSEVDTLGVDDLSGKIDGMNLSQLTDGVITNDKKQLLCQNLLNFAKHRYDIDCKKHMPTIFKCMQEERPLNTRVCDMLTVEKVYYALTNIKRIAVAPIYIKGAPWGFIIMDEDDDKRPFSEIEEYMLSLCGSMFANAIHRAEIDDELRQAHEEALLSSKAKSNFLANMSHEIRTPMNAISGMAEIILRESNGRGVAEYAHDIKTSCDNLLAIINDILDISKIESGKLDIVEKEYLLASMLNDVINLTRMRIGNKSLAFYTYIDSKLPFKVVGDEIRIKQILINLLGNAIKFTQSGHIGLRVSGEQLTGRCRLKFSVFDTGVGIKKTDISRLFEQFERVNTTKNRNIEGTGLGLAISKQLCEMMGGSIVVESVLGEGSIFTITVEHACIQYEPLARCENRRSVLIYEPREESSRSLCYTVENLGCECALCTNQSTLLENLTSLHFDYIFTPFMHLQKVLDLKDSLRLDIRVVVLSELNSVELASTLSQDIYSITLPADCLQVANVLNDTMVIGRGASRTVQFTAPGARVLIVDDNAVNLKVACGLMAPYKFETDTALSGLEAVGLVGRNDYDIVFMDHMMPEMDGIDATIAIRKLGEKYNSLPIIALTANAVVGAKELFINEGLNDFLSKPIELGRLNEILKRWLPEDKLIFTESSDKTMDDTNPLNVTVRGLEPEHGLGLLGGNVEMYLDILKIFLTDGVKRIKVIEELYKDGKISDFKTEVHAIKSACASIGALSLSAKAAAMEQAAQEGEKVYIDNHIKNFLASFNCILNGLKEHFKSDETMTSDDKPVGTKEELNYEIPVLAEAIRFVNIVEIEAILDRLFSREWPVETAELLQEIKVAIESYDYDGASELLERFSN